MLWGWCVAGVFFWTTNICRISYESSKCWLTTLRAGRFGVRIPTGARNLLPFKKSPDQLWGPPSLLFSGYHVLFQGWSGRGFRLTTQVKNEWSYTSTPVCLKGVDRDIVLSLYMLFYSRALNLISLETSELSKFPCLLFSLSNYTSSESGVEVGVVVTLQTCLGRWRYLTSARIPFILTEVICPLDSDFNIHSRENLKSVFCKPFSQYPARLTSGRETLPKLVLHRVRYSAFSLNFQYPIVSLMPSSSCLHPLPRIFVTAIVYCIFPAVLY